MHFTYKQLAETILNNWSEEQQNQDVTIYDEVNDEFYAAGWDFVELDRPGDGVLDDGHAYIVSVPENNTD